MALPTKKRVIVVGGGLAGLACTIKLAEEGGDVDLFSMVPVKRSHSVCAQGGINACNEIARQQGYSEYQHFDETILGGDFLADQPPVLEMTTWAPRIIDLLDRMGVPFNRTPEGQRALRLFGGSLYKRTFFAGATTGQQLLYALDEQTRRYETEGRVNKYEFWEFLWPVIHDGPNGPACVGIVAQDMRTMQIRPFRADAIPKSGNLVPRAIATREIFQVCRDGLGVGGGNMVYLDLRDEVKRIGRAAILAKLEGILEIYEKFVGTDPLEEPMKIFPAVHYTMGGLWCGFKRKETSPGGLEAGHPSNMMTNIPGLYAMGECSFAYHGANRLRANSLLSCIFDGLFGGPCIKNYTTDVARVAAADVPQSVFDAAARREEERQDWLVTNEGDENPYLL